LTHLTQTKHEVYVTVSTSKQLHAFPHYRIQQQRSAGSQPRYVTAKRLNNVRMNWFMLGTICGVALCFLFNLMIGGLLASSDRPALPDLKRVLNIELLPSFAQSNTPPAAAEAPTLEALPALAQLPKEPSETYPREIAHALQSGETLTQILTRAGIEYSQAHEAVVALRKNFDPRRLRVGQTIHFTLDKAEDDSVLLTDLAIATSRLETVELARNAKGAFHSKIAKKELTPELTLAGGTITSSLFETGNAAGIPDGVLAELVRAYSYDVDFQRQIHSGDQIEVLFERLISDEGETLGHGNIKYATLRLRGKPISIYRYTDRQGNTAYYHENGESVRKALLRTPINGARVSSGYGNRKHPILGYNRMHRGVDFAAPTGTPIYAAGDGVVREAGVKGAYGNYVRIQHNNTYATAYAHLHGFARGIRAGSQVKQGQVIGYVGSTGRSTGPHLHYEVLRNGAQVNPMSAKFNTGNALQGAELAAFKQSVSRIKQQVASMPRYRTTVASAQ
jgi:murein DD-endopeptidase MepM/ murein hydrolase activator NlpD